MKIERKEKEFQPITITLESQEEVDLIADLIAIAANHSSSYERNSSQDKSQQFFKQIHSHLEDFVSDDCELTYFEIPDSELIFK